MTSDISPRYPLAPLYITRYDTGAMSTELKVPPHNLEAEKSLLGALLIDNNAFIKVGDLIKPDDFYVDAHRMLFEVIVELFNKHQPLDVLSISNRLEETNRLVHVGGRTYLVELSNSVTTSTNLVHYATIIYKKATLRRLLGAANEISLLSFNEEEDVETIVDRAEQTLFAVSAGTGGNSFVPVSSILTEAFERIDELHREKGKLRGIATGFTALDALLGGYQKSDLVIIAARPSVGKTAFVLDTARNAALKSKMPVAIFSLEMSKEQLVDRMICSEANVDLWKMRTGRLSDQGEVDDFSRIGHALGTLAEAPIFIDDNPVSTVTQIRTKARRLQTEHGLGMIIVDYLQLIDSKTQIENRVQEIAAITRSLKQIARELNVPVIALSQLSRSVEMTKPAIPRLSHLRDSGSIEQDADVVIFLYRKAADRNYRMEDIPPEERNLAEIHIAKHRNGPTGMVKLFFDAARVSFKNMDTHPRPAGLPGQGRPQTTPPPQGNVRARVAFGTPRVSQPTPSAPPTTPEVPEM